MRHSFDKLQGEWTVFRECMAVVRSLDSAEEPALDRAEAPEWHSHIERKQTSTTTSQCSISTKQPVIQHRCKAQ